MAVYPELLIEAGGGVIDRSRLADRTGDATLIIGLGGTGTDAVMKIKKEMYKQLKPDDEDSVIPRYDSIRYLVVDSDTIKINYQTRCLSDIDENREFFSLFMSQKAAAMTFSSHGVLENRKELSWLCFENMYFEVEDDPILAACWMGGIRQIGRFLLVDRAESLYRKILTEMKTALIHAKNDNINVHICAGISGATGSGIFLDVCYLVREALNEIGKPDSIVCGYFFLPDVNLSVPEVGNTILSKHLKANGYAALQELDYCMNFGSNKDRFRMNYGFKEIDTAIKPVDLCYLISATDSSGNIIENGYQYAMGVVANYIISLLANEVLPPHIGESMPAFCFGGVYNYNIIGVAIAEMPLSEIATYLGTKLFEEYRDIYDKAPSEKNVKDFLMRSQLQYEDIRAALINGCAPKIQWGKQFDAELYKNTGNRMFIQRADEFFNNNIGIIVNNKTTMSEKLGEDYDISQMGTSMISRVLKNLFDHFVTKIEYGPFYAKRMIFGNNNPNIIHEVDGMIARCLEDLEAEARQDGRRNEELKMASDRLEGANMLNRGTRVEDYKEALNNWYVHLYRIDALKTLGDMLQEFKKQLSELDNKLFSVLTKVMDTLRNTFEVNAKVLSEGVRDDNTYTWKILSIPDIQAGLDEVVKKTDVSKTLYDLMTYMFENCKLWIWQDQAEILKLISAFVLKEFQDATKKTMTDYLREKYGVDSSDILAQAIERNIIQQVLWDKSTPLFWQNPAYNNNTIYNHITLTIPYDSAEIIKAAEDYRSYNNAMVTIRKSSITDKISMIRFYSGLPLYAYAGIKDLEIAYEEYKSPGIHLYEQGENNWDYILPSPIPASYDLWIPIERIAVKNRALIEEFEEAEKKGIVVKDEFNHWSIRQTSDVDFDSIEEDIKKLGSDVVAIKSYIDKIEEIKNDLEKKADLVEIKTIKSVPGCERPVMLDHYLLSPVLNGILRNELTKIDKLTDIIESLKMKSI